jgi:hypothetical protein
VHGRQVQSTGMGWLTGIGGERRARGERLGEGMGMGSQVREQVWEWVWGGGRGLEVEGWGWVWVVSRTVLSSGRKKRKKYFFFSVIFGRSGHSS